MSVTRRPVTAWLRNALRRLVVPLAMRSTAFFTLVAFGTLHVVAACARARAGRPDRVEPLATTGGRTGADATGSGFVVAAEGFIVTNRHVVTGCRRIEVRTDSTAGIPAHVVAVHATGDLAVVRADTTFGSIVAFRVGAPIRPGDDVVAIGFPLAGLLADEANVTTGTVNAMAGIHNDPTILQMSAPVQQGSSGGPLLDASGNVVGIVVTKLNAQIVAEATGDLPQNVNFALKGDLAREFLARLSVPFHAAESTTPLRNADVGAIGRRATVMVGCYR